MSRSIRRVASEGPGRPRVVPVPFAPVPDLTMLAMVARTAGRSTHPDKGEIARQFGWAFNGSVSRSIEPQLRRLAGEGLAESRRRPDARRGNRYDEWFPTDAGRRRIEEQRREIGPLPESPEHRLWRVCRALAEKGIGAARESAREALGDATAMLDDPRAAGERIARAMDRLDWRLRRLGVFVYCLRDWSEPDDEVHEPHLDRWETRLARFPARLEMLNATAEHEAAELDPVWEITEGCG